jgi:hypothetical protein
MNFVNDIYIQVKDINNKKTKHKTTWNTKTGQAAKKKDLPSFQLLHSYTNAWCNRAGWSRKAVFSGQDELESGILESEKKKKKRHVSKIKS